MLDGCVFGVLRGDGGDSGLDIDVGNVDGFVPAEVDFEDLDFGEGKIYAGGYVYLGEGDVLFDVGDEASPFVLRSVGSDGGEVLDRGSFGRRSEFGFLNKDNVDFVGVDGRYKFSNFVSDAV